jgi:hypothetical protein
MVRTFQCSPRYSRRISACCGKEPRAFAAGDHATQRAHQGPGRRSIRRRVRGQCDGSVRDAAPTSWIRRFARKPAGGATASSRSASRVIAATCIARQRVAPPPTTPRSMPDAGAIRVSPEGCLDHRDRRRAYRARVSDQTSRPAPPSQGEPDNQSR